MSLMPFSSRSSSRSSGAAMLVAKKLSNRKYTISLSFRPHYERDRTIIAIGWIFAFSHRRQGV